MSNTSTALTITATARSYPKTIPYQKIKDVILGKKYQLSLVFLGETRAQALNVSTRGKTYTPNVLSFPLTNTAGEIYITPQVAKKDAHRFEMNYTTHVGYLYIHGLLHLKGYDHSPKMEQQEAQLMQHFFAHTL